MAKRKAAPPEEDSEEEEFVDEDLMGSEDDDDEEAAAGGGRDFDEEEDDDEELEAEMAALESVRKERGMDRGDKPRINNEAGLDASIQGTSHPLAADPPHQSQSRRRRDKDRFALIAPTLTAEPTTFPHQTDFGWTHKAKWIDHMVVAGEKDAPHVKDINDDLARETHFYEQALSSANVAVRMLKDLGVPVKRPPDFYAEMVKSDEHMKRVRAELIFEQTAQETREERRKARESKRYGKQVEAEKLKERTLKKKESIKNLDKWRKQRKQNNYSEDGAKAPEGFEDGFRNKDSPKGRKRSTQETRQKREFKDEKFGFGGRKRVSVISAFFPCLVFLDFLDVARIPHRRVQGVLPASPDT